METRLIRDFFKEKIFGFLAPLAIQVASREDAPLMAAMHGASFGEARWSLTQIANSISLTTSFAWIAHRRSAARGFILCQIAGSEAEILTFCTLPAARRKGVGRRLLATALDAARRKQVKRIFLEVAADNNAAIALYEKSGFVRTGKRPGYYRRGGKAVDAVMLSLDL